MSDFPSGIQTLNTIISSEVDVSVIAIFDAGVFRGLNSSLHFSHTAFISPIAAPLEDAAFSTNSTGTHTQR